MAVLAACMICNILASNGGNFNYAFGASFSSYIYRNSIFIWETQYIRKY